MRKLVAYQLMSLDGVAEDPDKFIHVWDEVMDANLARVIGSQDAVLLGRRSYEEWAAFWRGSDIQPFSPFINGVAKYVATSTPLDPEWTNASAIDADLEPFVNDLKAQPGKDIGLHASISLTQALLRLGLIDELSLVIAPVISGRGRRLFEDDTEVRLETIRSETSPSGHLLIDYRVLPVTAD